MSETSKQKQKKYLDNLCKDLAVNHARNSLLESENFSQEKINKTIKSKEVVMDWMKKELGRKSVN